MSVAVIRESPIFSTDIGVDFIITSIGHPTLKASLILAADPDMDEMDALCESGHSRI